jgi:hypothetical protein
MSRLRVTLGGFLGSDYKDSKGASGPYALPFQTIVLIEDPKNMIQYKKIYSRTVPNHNY